MEQVREVQASNGFSAQGDRRLLFGLGDGAAQITANVHWCGAETAERFVLEANRYHPLRQGRRQ